MSRRLSGRLTCFPGFTPSGVRLLCLGCAYPFKWKAAPIHSMGFRRSESPFGSCSFRSFRSLGEHPFVILVFSAPPCNDDRKSKHVKGRNSQTLRPGGRLREISTIRPGPARTAAPVGQQSVCYVQYRGRRKSQCAAALCKRRFLCCPCRCKSFPW